MTKKPLGCLSRTGVFTSLLVLILLAGVVVVWGGQLFSPGPLNAQGGGEPLGGVRSHAETGGRCSACHVPLWGDETMSDRCMLCHTDVAAQLRDPISLHRALMTPGETQPCYNCHPEHRGDDARLTVVDPDTFPHQATGYSLQGHQQTAEGLPFVCADCHGEDLTHFDPARCPNCHQGLDAAYLQAHESAFGSDCLACHDGLDTYGASFDHAQTTFPLVGRHAPLACTDCHMGARSVTNLQGTPQNCFACHQADDAHDGQFGQNCAVCHTPDGWEQATFDHNQTAFLLTGGHVEVTCQNCHAGNVFRGTPQNCFACHQADDAHDGQFGTDCAACHTPDGWEQVTFDHNQTAFPLTGRHVEVACQNCHTDYAFQGTPQNCFACHQADDAHAGQLGTDCAACHTPDGWEQATFDHNQTAFPLTGRHVEVTCQNCHAGNVFQGTPQNCFACHQADDAHAGQFGTDCAACHTPDGWEQVTFDHNQTAFPLTGAHLETACARCHVNGVYRGTPQACATCHADPAFHLGLLGSDCASCHSTAAWLPARYDRAHAFPINHGGRGTSPCRTCHPNALSAYTCYGCHEHDPAEIERKHREEGISDFQDCVRCHPTGREDEGGDD